MSEDPLRVCTVCGAPAERMMSAGAGLLFKGSGFYITDYRSDSYKKAADADSGSSSGKEAAATKDSAPSGSAAPAKDVKSAQPAKDVKKSGGSSGTASSKGE